MQGLDDHECKNGKAEIQNQCGVVAFFETIGFLCAEILGNVGRNGIADGYKDQGENILHPHRCCVPGKRLCAEGVYHRLHDHHADGHGGLLKDRRNGNRKHGAV